MNSNPRRMFLQAAGATLVVPFVDTTLNVAQARQAHDPVLRELARQAKALAQRVSKPEAALTGEAARQTANLLRVLAAHSGTSGFDARITKAFRQGVAANGRQAVLTRRPDLAAAAAELGITGDLARFGAPPDDPAARSAALDAILKNGVTSGWLNAAQELDRIAAKIDTHRGVQLIRQSPSDCASGQWGLFMLEVSMIMACSYGLAAGPEVCAIATGAYIAYRLSLLIMGCG